MSIALSTESCGVIRMSLSDALALGPAAWSSLESRRASPSPFMSWAWHRAWLEAVPAEATASDVLVLRGADGGLQALLPLTQRRVRFHRVPVTALTWATGEIGCPDHLDIPALPGAAVAEFAPLLEALRWDVVILSNMAGGNGATATRHLCEVMAARGYEFRRQPLWPCPYLDLPADWDAYLGSLTATRRQTLRRKERHLRHEDMTVTDYAPDRVAEGLQHLIALHTQRWQNDGQGGAFADPLVQRLHRRFASELAARGQLWLSTLDVAGAPVAAWYGFAWGDTVYFYQSGRDPKWERHSVGLVLMGTMIQRAIERGYRRFDFLRGADTYKRQWTTTDRMTEQITIFRRGLGGRALRVLDAAGDLRARLRGTAGGEA
ncbi:MAG TPA: GNAT family N-acetyltransferase [Gemmatimonadales bacterium]|nr:GNAT family N-acetyltransferase [Gemmatimonadales bacterium]